MNDLSRTELFNGRFHRIAAVEWRLRGASRASMSTAEHLRLARSKALVQAALRRLYRDFDDLFAD